MKKLVIIFSTVLALFATSTLVTAQDIMTEGSLSFELTDVKSDNPNVKQAMKGATSQVSFKGTINKNEIQMMNGAVRIQKLTDETTQESSVYMDLMGKQIKVSVPDSVQKRKAKELSDNTNVTYDEATTKVIKGYKCYKATVETLNPDGSVKEYQLYITDAVKVSAAAISGLPKSLKGFPLEYTIKAGETELAYTLKTLDKMLAADALKMPDSYTKMDYKEFEANIGKKLGM
jgi:hypothetical protein